MYQLDLIKINSLVSDQLQQQSNDKLNMDGMDSGTGLGLGDLSTIIIH